MTPTPAAPAKKSPVPMIIAIIIAAFLSLCCCLAGIINIVSPDIIQSSGLTSGSSGNFSTVLGLLCIGAAVIPWILPLVVIVARRQKK